MVNVIYDKRTWEVTIENRDCPLLYYPNNIHGCRDVRNKKGECILEFCPIRIGRSNVHEDIDKYYSQE